jgi:hypothetical protein
MHLALLCLVVQVSDLSDLAEEMAALNHLPPPEMIYDSWCEADGFARQVRQWSGGGGTLRRHLAPTLREAESLCLWWEWAFIAVACEENWGQWPCEWSLQDRLCAARCARLRHDWMLYGLPPTIPYWRLPVR